VWVGAVLAMGWAGSIPSKKKKVRLNPT